MTTSGRVLSLSALFASTACSIEPIDLGDRQCDADHPCAAEYTCVDEICERTDELDDEEEDDEAADDDGEDNAG